MRLASLRVGVVAFVAAAQQPQPPQTPAPETRHVQNTPPPGKATPEDAALLKRATEALDSKKADVSAILVDPTYMAIHERTEFRALIKRHATAKPLTVSGPKEPGTRLAATMKFVDKKGEPIRGGLIYLYHTSAKGWYSDRAAHIQANAGDFRHARLFGYALTDDQGRLELKTIRPASYPNTDLPQHIHIHVYVEGKEVLVTELLFEDDPKLTPSNLEEAAREGAIIVKVKKETDGSERCEAEFTVRD